MLEMSSYTIPILASQGAATKRLQIAGLGRQARIGVAVLSRQLSGTWQAIDVKTTGPPCLQEDEPLQLKELVSQGISDSLMTIR